MRLPGYAPGRHASGAGIMSRHTKPRAVSRQPALTSQETENAVQPIRKSDKLANVCYDIRGPATWRRSVSIRRKKSSST